LIGRRGPFEWENLGKELPFGEPSQISLIIQEGKPDGLDGQSCLIDLADVGGLLRISRRVIVGLAPGEVPLL
jgi:hypothetical protein